VLKDTILKEKMTDFTLAWSPNSKRHLPMQNWNCFYDVLQCFVSL